MSNCIIQDHFSVNFKLFAGWISLLSLGCTATYFAMVAGTTHSAQRPASAAS